MVAVDITADGFHHIVGWLAGTVFFLEDHITVQVKISEKRIVNVFIRKNQVSFANRKFLRKFAGGGKAEDIRSDH